MPHSRRILFIEDHEDTRELITLVLEHEGYVVTTEITLAGALKTAATNEFDLYVLDTCLPDGSGFELCERIRMFDSATPILFYSGAAYDGDKLEAIRAGAQGYLVKPCSFAELLRTVASLISRVPSSQHISKARDLVA
jgi:two-component system, OmpR family, alkaline phosphatase synthesis response regulator PhoP